MLKFILVFLPLWFANSSKKYDSPNFYVITNVKIKCISKCDAIGNDAVFVSINSSYCTDKSTATKTFSPGITKSYPEIGPNNGSTVSMWCIGIGNFIRVYEKDLLDPNDLIIKVKLTQAIANSGNHTVTGINGTGKYSISFKLTEI